jgi:hypothetical protein
MADTRHIRGLDALSKELQALGPDIAKKALRSATSGALTPTFKKIKMAAPVGSEPHRTFKGRLVAPGFLQRSLKRSSRFFPRTGKAIAKIKILPEAFYGGFYDVGVTGKFPKLDWFTKTFENDREAIEKRFSDLLRAKIKKLAGKKR